MEWSRQRTKKLRRVKRDSASTRPHPVEPASTRPAGTRRTRSTRRTASEHDVIPQPEIDEPRRSDRNETREQW